MKINLTKFNDHGMFLLRFVTGAIFILHGLPKFSNVAGLATALGNPSLSWFVYILALVEVVAGVAMIFGIYIHLAAAALAVDMLGAIYFKSMVWGVGFMGQKATGWEFDLIILAALIAIATTSSNHFIFLPKKKAEINSVQK